MKVKSLSRFRLLATPWTAAYQAPPSMGFSRQEYWSGMPLPSPLYPTTHCKEFPQSLGSALALYSVLRQSQLSYPTCFFSSHSQISTSSLDLPYITRLTIQLVFSISTWKSSKSLRLNMNLKSLFDSACLSLWNILLLFEHLTSFRHYQPPKVQASNLKVILNASLMSPMIGTPGPEP